MSDATAGVFLIASVSTVLGILIWIAWDSLSDIMDMDMEPLDLEGDEDEDY